MFRLTVLALLSPFVLLSCDNIVKGEGDVAGSSIAQQIRISSQSKPEIVASFEAIAKATHEHNRVFIQNVECDKPANELAFNAGIAHLDRSARENQGLARKIIDAMAATCTYEKGLFVPFDTMSRQAKGMQSWTKNQALQRRGYIQIIEQQIVSCDEAVAYLERGEEPLLRRNFEMHGVPGEVAEEFLRLRELGGKEIKRCKLGMFQEWRLAMQCYRDAIAMVAADPAKANEHLAEANEHQQKAKQLEGRMIAEVRKRSGAVSFL